MRIMFVDTRLTGHHKTYLTSLFSACSDAYVAILSEDKIDGFPQNRVFNIVRRTNGIFTYCHVIGQLKKIAQVIKPDIIHFLTGDSLYRFFGVAINRIYPKAKFLVTCHHLRRSFLRDVSYRHLGAISDAIVVHTECIRKSLFEMGLRNVYHIEYPQFGNSPIVSKKTALAKLGVEIEEKKVLLALGGTRRGKGLDVLLEALKGVREPFHLIVAGKEEDIKREYILEHSSSYRENVSLFLEFLSDEKFSLCLNAADIVVLPYRKIFNGASGPLGEGVWHYKMIVGPDHKSLGSIINSNHLGKTFVSEDPENLRSALRDALVSNWNPDETYLRYRESLDPSLFQKKYLSLYLHLTDNK